MFIADGLIFLELQKTGGSHIGRLLEQYVGGQTTGKHHRLKEDAADRYVIGSIRNPWDWYVSLWAYGCGGKGSIRMRTGRRVDIDYYFRGLPEAMGRERLNVKQLMLSTYYDAIKPVARWQQTYQDSSDPEGFRKWLRLLLDNKRRYDIGEGYGFSPLSLHAGLMSYRYFRLFTINDSVFHDRRLESVSGLADFDEELNISNGVIRMESLEEDFIHVLTEANITLSEVQRASIRNKEEGKTNVSQRNSAAYYYDDETLALVAEKERYLIGKYGYIAPIPE